MLPSQAGVLVIWPRSVSLGEQESGGQEGQCHRHAPGSWGVGRKLSSPMAPKAETHGLPDPPSQLSAEEDEERERERLVPETVQQGGRSHSHTEASGHLETLTDRRWGGHRRPGPTRGSRSPKLTPGATLPSGGLGGQVMRNPQRRVRRLGGSRVQLRSP